MLIVSGYLVGSVRMTWIVTKLIALVPDDHHILRSKWPGVWAFLTAPQSGKADKPASGLHHSGQPGRAGG